MQSILGKFYGSVDSKFSGFGNSPSNNNNRKFEPLYNQKPVMVEPAVYTEPHIQFNSLQNNQQTILPKSSTSLNNLHLNLDKLNKDAFTPKKKTDTYSPSPNNQSNSKDNEKKNDLLKIINNQILDAYKTNPYINPNGINSSNPAINSLNTSNPLPTTQRKYSSDGEDVGTDLETLRNKRQYIKNSLFKNARDQKMVMLKGTKDPEKMAKLMNENLEHFQEDFSREISII